MLYLFISALLFMLPKSASLSNLLILSSSRSCPGSGPGSCPCCSCPGSDPCCSGPCCSDPCCSG